MTGPVTTEALVEARTLVRHSLKVGAPGLAEPAREAIVRSIMLKLEGKVLAPLLAALQQVTAERDEYALVLSDCAAALAQVPLGQLPGCVDMMVVSALDAPLPNGERSEIIAAAERIKARVTAERDEARAELARLRAEGEADLEACAQHCEGYAALNADEATRRGKWLGEEKAARDEKCAALWATHHAANEMAGFIRDRIKSRTALARAATAREG